MARRMQTIGFSVETASNGDEALAKMRHRFFDCVFLDIKMPVLDGFGCAKSFRELEVSCYVLLSTNVHLANNTSESYFLCLKMTSSSYDHSLERCKHRPPF